MRPLGCIAHFLWTSRRSGLIFLMVSDVSQSQSPYVVSTNPALFVACAVTNSSSGSLNHLHWSEAEFEHIARTPPYASMANVEVHIAIVRAICPRVRSRIAVRNPIDGWHSHVSQQYANCSPTRFADRDDTPITSAWSWRRAVRRSRSLAALLSGNCSVLPQQACYREERMLFTTLLDCGYRQISDVKMKALHTEKNLNKAA